MRVWVVGISGGSASGKSTLAHALVAALGEDRAVIVREDAYYWPRSRYAGRDPRSIDFDHPDAKDLAAFAEHVAALKAGRSVVQPVYDFDLHDRSEAVSPIPPRPFIVLEGIHALTVPAVRALVDLSVYVDTPDDVRLARRIRRDVTERGRDVEGVLAQYLSTVRPAHYQHTYPARFHADLVLADDGPLALGGPTPAAVARLATPVLERLRALAGDLQPR